jgi:hypothetical protein
LAGAPRLPELSKFFQLARRAFQKFPKISKVNLAITTKLADVR